MKYPVPSSIIQATLYKQSKQVNSLADEGVIHPVTFTMSDGITRTANSMWAATDWLKEQGYYEDLAEPPVQWGILRINE